ncbi:jhy protein homolog [Python bivittatus]|uniref:Jhy protein homolog n=1 Tax=Python bivittatus TaxID=176946 RepID=A0A9F5J3T4_PYTBI|nr:jhy protein homolog [Python bivittatus]
MNAGSPSPKGLTEAHRRYSFLETASEGLSQNESDSESLAQEARYQWELQKRIHKNQERVSRACREQADESMEEDSLEETSHLSEEGGSDGEETRRPRGGQDGGGNPENASPNEEITDKYSDLRYDPNWKDSEKGRSFLELEESHQEECKSSSFTSLELACHPSQGFVSRNCQLQERPQNIPSVIAREFWIPCDEPADGWGGSFRLDKKGREPEIVYHYNSNDSLTSSGSRIQLKVPKPRSEKDFIEKNKLTLGLAAHQNNSYLRLHGKKQREGSQEKAHQSARSLTDGMKSGQTASLREAPLSESSIQHPLGTQVELRRHLSGDNSSEDSPFSAQAPYLPQHHAKKNSKNLTFARKPLQQSSFHNFPGLLSPCAGEKKKCQHSLENISGPHHPYSYRCTVSEPQPFTHHGKHWNALGHKGVSYAYNGGQQEPVNGAVSSCKPWHIYTEEIPNNYAFHYSGPPQPLAPHPINRTLSPTARLIQAIEQQHREISQLADDHLARNQVASMFPPIIQRGESDSQLHLESCEETQPVLSRSNSEGYLLQMEKQKERKEKENRKGSRAKGYMKMDVRLGGLGPDYETIKEKSEKMKHQKVYAKQVNEQNLKNIASTRKRQPKTENKSVVSRQKALEYAKTIPKPRLFVSRPSEQETKEEKNLARTLNGENLPPISSLESLKNRHEKEKQVVAAFKTLHIV